MPDLFLLDNVNKGLLILVNARLQDCIKTTMTSTKGKILKTALHLFAQSGFDAVSTSQIADALSITKELYTDTLTVNKLSLMLSCQRWNKTIKKSLM